MIRSFTLTALAGIALTACSIQFDSQYGLRLEPAERGARSTDIQSAPAAPAVTNEALQNSDWSTAAEPYTAHILEPSHAVPLYNLDQDALANLANEPIPANLANEATNYQANEPFARYDYESQVAQIIAPKPQRNMTVAWVLWAIPAILVLFAAGGLLLNFGAHWYYLGYHRKGMAKTIVWAITLAVLSVVVFLSSALGMNLLAALIALILLVPLGIIQIIGLVKDFFALQKIANKKARGRKHRIV